MADRDATSGPINGLGTYESGMSSEVMLMLLADARLPTGAHTQSAGLEPALRGGMPPTQVPQYIRARLRTVTLVEAGAAVLARAAVLDLARPGPPAPGASPSGPDRAPTLVDTSDARADPATSRADQLGANVTGGTRVNDCSRAVEWGHLPARQGLGDDPRGQGVQVGGGGAGAQGGEPGFGLAAALAEVDAAWRARTVSPALRETSVLLGRGYVRLIRQLWPGSAGAAALQAIGRPGRAVVVGVAAALAGLSAAQLVRLIGYDDAQTVAAATLKLEPLDPVVSTGWVMAAGVDIERMVDEVAALTDITQLPAFGAPLIEQWAEVHATTSQRLFRA